MAHKYITLNVNKATADNSIADIRNAIPKLECFPERGLVLTLPTGTANYRYLLRPHHILKARHSHKRIIRRFQQLHHEHGTGTFTKGHLTVNGYVLWFKTAVIKGYNHARFTRDM